MYFLARVEYLVPSSPAAFSALQISQPVMQWGDAWPSLASAKWGSSSARGGGRATLHAQHDACFIHKVVQQLRTRSEVFQCCSAMTKIIQLADRKNVTYKYTALKCVPSRVKHIVLENHYPATEKLYLDALLIRWQNARYLFKFPALLKPSGICTSHLITGLHHWSVKWTSLTSHSVTVSSFMQLSLSIMQFTELPNIQENQCSLRLEMAGEYSFDHSDLESELFKLIPCSFWPLKEGKVCNFLFLLPWHHIARNEPAFPLQSTFSFLSTLKPGTQC